MDPVQGHGVAPRLVDDLELRLVERAVDQRIRLLARQVVEVEASHGELLAVFNAVVRVEPDNGEAQLYRGLMFRAMGMSEQAITAYSKGLRPIWVVSRHVIRNAAIPILTTAGLSLRFSLSSLPVVEFFFGWPGVGFTLLKSIA